jgi:hypothetical protein
VLIAYVQACNGDVSEWEDRWARLGKSKKGAAELPAAEAHLASGHGAAQHAAAGAGPAAPEDQQSSEVYVITSARPRDAHW